MVTPANSHEKVEDAISVLQFFDDISDSLFEIIDLVQKNQSFFGGHGGECCVRLAAAKLKALVAVERED